MILFSVYIWGPWTQCSFGTPVNRSDPILNQNSYHTHQQTAKLHKTYNVTNHYAHQNANNGCWQHVRAQAYILAGISLVWGLRTLVGRAPELSLFIYLFIWNLETASTVPRLMALMDITVQTVHILKKIQFHLQYFQIFLVYVLD